MELADESGGEGAVCGGAKFVLEVLRVFVIDEEVVFAGVLGMVGAGTVGLVVGGKRLGSASDGTKEAGTVYLDEAEIICQR